MKWNVSSTMLKHIFVIMMLAIVCEKAWCAAVMVDNQELFKQALTSAEPGTEIVIRDGQYKDWWVQSGCSGTEDKPIIIRAENPGKAIFAGNTMFALSGSYVVLDSLHFDECVVTNGTVRLEGASYCKVVSCVFVNCTGKKHEQVLVIWKNASHNVIEKCVFDHNAAKAISIRIADPAQTNGAPQHNIIDSNLFKDVPSLGDNGRETIQIGYDPMKYGQVKSYTVVENNLFLRCNGESEIISNKSSNNQINNNMFIDCYGELVLRGGSYVTVSGNTFMRCKGGIRISGTHHIVKKNLIAYPQESGIRIMHGTGDDEAAFYRTVTDCQITDNQILYPVDSGIHVGIQYMMDWTRKKHGYQDRPPHDNLIANNFIQVMPRVEAVIVDHAPDNQVMQNTVYVDSDVVP